MGYIGEWLPKTNIKGLWHLNSSAVDASGNGNNLTLGGSPSYANGAIAQGLDLETSSSQYAKATASASLSITGIITILASIVMESAGGDRAIVTKDYPAGGQRSFAFMKSGADKMYFYYFGAGGITQIDVTSATIPVGVKTRVGISVDVATKVGTFYINGDPVASSNSSSLGNAIVDSTAELVIGARQSATYDSFWDGVIDEVVVLAQTMTAAEHKKWDAWAAGKYV